MKDPFRQHLSHTALRPLVVLERHVSHHRRHVILRLAGVVICVIVLLITLAIVSASIFSSVPEGLHRLLPRVVGVLFIVLSLWLLAWILEIFFRAYAFRRFCSPDSPLELEAAEVFDWSRDGNLRRGFFSASVGRLIAARLGLEAAALKRFLKNSPIPEGGFADLLTVNKCPLTLRDVAVFLFSRDEALRDFLAKEEIGEPEFIGVVEWVRRQISQTRDRERWWAREHLERIPPLARDWAYGGAYRLARYSVDLISHRPAQFAFADRPGRTAEVEKLETILGRSKEANAMLIAEAGSAKKSIMLSLAGKMRRGRVIPALVRKRLLLFDAALFVSNFKERSLFEQEIIKLFNEAVAAGNVVLAVSDFPLLIESGVALGSDVTALLDPYLASASVQVVALADTDKFHRSIETRPALTGQFEKVFIEDLDLESVVVLLGDIVPRIESESRILLTYPAVRALADSALRYFTYEGLLDDKAVDLLVEIAPWAAHRGLVRVGKDEVEQFLREKTAIPLGKITDTEKEIFLNLENIIHRRVVGQNEAVTAVSNAMRRARAGVRNTKRPIGSFLFLGPTGVGKTETAKALAETFFGAEEKMSRLDMSEYAAGDALGRLIGSLSASRAGLLAKALRENPYTVLLLDEFEKTHPDVLNLFLQILDEGFFSDVEGKRVNVRNTLIVATSNAGSDLIWQLIRDGKDLSVNHDEIIERIIAQGIFRPELINRFDAVVFFRPLSREDEKQVAKLMLEKLTRRLQARSVTLEVNEALIDYVAREGVNETFGARPMNRFIQDKVEQVIAGKLISGEVKGGSKVRFTAEPEPSFAVTTK